MQLLAATGGEGWKQGVSEKAERNGVGVRSGACSWKRDQCSNDKWILIKRVPSTGRSSRSRQPRPVAPFIRLIKPRARYGQTNPVSEESLAFWQNASGGTGRFRRFARINEGNRACFSVPLCAMSARKESGPCSRTARLTSVVIYF